MRTEIGVCSDAETASDACWTHMCICESWASGTPRPWSDILLGNDDIRASRSTQTCVSASTEMHTWTRQAWKQGHACRLTTGRQSRQNSSLCTHTRTQLSQRKTETRTPGSFSYGDFFYPSEKVRLRTLTKHHVQGSDLVSQRPPPRSWYPISSPNRAARNG